MWSAPPRIGSLGARAVDLAAEAGLYLDDWQQWQLEESLGLRPDGRWSSFEVGLSVARQNGKGSILEARELAGLFLLDAHGEPLIGERLLTHTAHEFKTSQEHFIRLATLLEALPARYKRRIKQVREAHGSEAIELKDGRRLRFLARSSGSGRGFSGDLVVLDEAMILWLASISALVPSMAARALITVAGPQLWYTGSPGLGDDRSEVFARVRDRGLAGAERLFWAEWGAGAANDHNGSEVDYDDRDEWRRANPALASGRMEEEFIEAERPALGDDFPRERLGIWGTGVAKPVIDPDTWAARGDESSKPKLGAQIAFAVYVPSEGGSACIARAGVRSDGRVHVEVDTRSGTTWSVDRLAELSRKRNAPVVLDGGSRAISLVPALVKAGVDPVVYGTRQIVGACSEFVDKIDEDQLRHLSQPELNVAVDGARKRKVGEAWAWHRRDASVDISPLWAATLAVRGLGEEPPRRKTGRMLAV